MEIKLSVRAEKDVEAIFSYTETIWGIERRKQTANQINQILDFLVLNPKSGRETLRLNIFVLVIPKLPYVLLYRKTKTTITILQLIHTKRSR
jgi:plasmid stabilization system protein ParE